MRKLVALTLVLAVGGTSAQTLEPEAQLPDWSLPQWHTIAKRKGLTISTRINPFVWRGDFDGDKRVDLALIVKNSQTGKEGLVFLLRSNRSVVLGAGSPFGNGSDDFSWIDFWSVEESGSLQRSYYEPAVRQSTDGILVAKEGSSSALIYLKNGKPRWQQQGD